VAGFTRPRSKALKKVKQALVLNRLDTKTLVSHDNSALLAMLAPDSRGDQEGLRRQELHLRDPHRQRVLAHQRPDPGQGTGHLPGRDE
jgi:hypothetical protein